MEAGKRPENALIWQGGLEAENDRFTPTTTKVAWLEYRKRDIQQGYEEQAMERIVAHLDSLMTWVDGFGPDILEILNHSCTRDFLRELRNVLLPEDWTMEALQGMCPAQKLPCFMILDAVACGVPTGSILLWSNPYDVDDVMMQDVRLSWQRLREAMKSGSDGKIDIPEHPKTLRTEAFRLALARFRAEHKLSVAEERLASAERKLVGAERLSAAAVDAILALKVGILDSSKGLAAKSTLLGEKDELLAAKESVLAAERSKLAVQLELHRLDRVEHCDDW